MCVFSFLPFFLLRITTKKFFIFRGKLMTADDSFVNGHTRMKKERKLKFVIVKIHFSFDCISVKATQQQFIYTSNKNVLKHALNCLKIYLHWIFKEMRNGKLLLCLNCVSSYTFKLSILLLHDIKIFSFFSSSYLFL